MAHYFDGPLHLNDTPGELVESKAARKRQRADVDSDDNEEGEQDPPHQNFQNGLQAAKNHQSTPRMGAPQHNIRTQHYHVLNTILHRCILEQDYSRASRALGTLLRFELAGNRCNIRKNNLWLLAAEILLRRDSATNTELSGAYSLQGAQDNEHSSSLRMDQQTEPTLTLDGFRETRQYLDLLILQYPKFSRNPWKLDTAEQFYPVMFRLWILQVQSEAERSIRMLESTNLEHGSNSNEPQSLTGRDTMEELIQQVERTQRERANEILLSLTELLRSPAYDKNDTLLSLRSEIEAWVRSISSENLENPEQTQTHL